MTIAASADHDKAFEIIRDVQLIDLTHRDAQFVRGELADAIAQAIVAAVQAEREACESILAELIGEAELTRADEKKRMDIYHRDCQIAGLTIALKSIRTRSEVAK